MFRYFPTQARLHDRPARRLSRGRVRSWAWRAGSALSGARSAFFGAVTSAVNEAWGVEKQRSFWKHRLVSFLMLVAAGGGHGARAGVVSFIQMAETSRFGADAGQRTWFMTLQTLLFRYLATGAPDVGTGLVFYFIPNARRGFATCGSAPC